SCARRRKPDIDLHRSRETFPPRRVRASGVRLAVRCRCLPGIRRCVGGKPTSRNAGDRGAVGMPFTLALTYVPTPALRVHASALPLWRRLQALADAAVDRVTTVWHGLFTDVRDGLDEQA